MRVGYDTADPYAVAAHAQRVFVRMTRTPQGAKRKRLAAQHVELANQAAEMLRVPWEPDR